MKVDFNKLKDSDRVSYNILRASWLQKAVRRAHVGTALALADTYILDGQEKALERKLDVFMAEDVGMGNPWLLLELEKYTLKERVCLLANSPKNRESDRFLLATRDCYEVLKKEKYAQEVKVLDIILKASSLWFENKRIKSHREKLASLFKQLEDKNPERSELIHKCLVKYMELSKKKAFGCRTYLALSVLCSLRKTLAPLVLDKTMPENYTLPLFVDDFALDKHTSFGSLLNRGMEHWIKEGSVVIPEYFYEELLYKGKEKYPYSLLFRTKLK